MNIKLMVLLSGFILILLSCNIKQSNEGQTYNICEKILVHGKIDNLLQIDSIISDINAIPLETKKECLINNPEKVLFFGEKMFIQSSRNNLFVFDTTGHYLREIGKKGKGPGEFLELRDFDIDQNGYIYILDFAKILKYNPDGTFVKKFSFRFSPVDRINCNPMQFALSKDENFFIWGGSLGIKENNDRKLFIMYKMTNEGKITNRYFPLKNKMPSNTYRFKHYKDLTLIDPIFGNDTIYSIQADKVESRYFLDFGKKAFNQPVPENFESLGKFTSDIDTRLYHSINGFTETNDWLYFRFNYNHFFTSGH